jgi:hypothetical protein
MKGVALFILALIAVATALPVPNPQAKDISYAALRTDTILITANDRSGLSHEQANPPNRGCEPEARCKSYPVIGG